MDSIPRLSLAMTPTPVAKLRHWLPSYPLYIKRDDLTGMEVSGNKIRKLEYLLAEAMAQGADMVVTCGGIQSNHVRATAAAAARLGLKSHLILRGEAPKRAADLEGNMLLNVLLGATFRWVPASQWCGVGAVMNAEVADLQLQGHRPYAISIGGSSAIGSLGYVDVIREIRDYEEENGLRFGAVVHATGSGGTAAGLLWGREKYGLSARIYSVDVCGGGCCGDDGVKPMVDKVFAEGASRYGLDTPSMVDWEIVSGFSGAGYARSTPEEMELYAEVARTEGFFLDPVYTGKAFRGMILLAREEKLLPRNEPVLFIHTGGLFGLFAADHNENIPWP